MGQHPDLGHVTSDMRTEWRAEQDAATADAAAQWRHGRTLGDWLQERAGAGDRIAVTVLEQRFAGFVEELGDDLISLRCAFGRVDIQLLPALAIFFEINDKALEGGARAPVGRSFRDVLRARDAQPDTTVGTMHDPEGVDGTMFVGADFLSVVALLGAETVVPLRSVVWVAPRRT